MKIIFNGETYDVVSSFTLKEFAEDYVGLPVKLLVNGSRVEPDSPLENYNVVEKSDDGVLIDNTTKTSTVNVHLCDFTGKSGFQDVSSCIEDVKKLYNEPVNVTVIRNAQTVTTNIIEPNDRLIIVKASGHKGA